MFALVRSLLSNSIWGKSMYLESIETLSLIDMPKHTLDIAYWNGLLKRMYLKFSGTEIKTHEDKLNRYYNVVKPIEGRSDYLLEDVWKKNEEILNESLNLLFLSLPPNSLNKVLQDSFNLESTDHYKLCSLNWSLDIRPLVGNPDIIFCDENSKKFLFIEFKISSMPTNCKFSFQQYVKYNSIMQVLEKQGYRSQFAVLSPEDKFQNCVEKNEMSWFVEKGNKLNVDLNLITDDLSCPSSEVKSYEEYRNYISKLLTKYSIDIDPFDLSDFKYISFRSLQRSLSKIDEHYESEMKKLFRYATVQ